MAVSVISKETIKPLNPTPPHLRNFKIGILDQLMRSIYIPLVLFYPPNDHANRNTSQIISHLKNSLAKTLTWFYPLAGRMKDCKTVDCNDSGVTFVVAHTSRHLDEILKNPPTDTMCDFLPFKTYCFQDTTQGLVGIQVTTLGCGGIVIGVCMHHRISDAYSMSYFIKSWADEAHTPKSAIVNNPDFTTAQMIFPSADSGEEIEKIVTDNSFEAKSFVQRRYVFDKNAIASLQAKASSDATPNPTRNEALTSFIWKHLIEAYGTITGSSYTSIIKFAVNLRPRFNPPFSSSCFGNLVVVGSGSFLYSLDGEMKPDVSGLASELHESLGCIDSDFFSEIQKPGVLDEKLQEFASSMVEGLKLFQFTNWCNMGHYTIDFGWGIPVWITLAQSNDMLNTRCTIFMDSPSGTGIEVYVIAEEADVSVMEKNPEFLAFASINPSVISY